VWHLACGPLVGKQGLELVAGAAVIYVGKSQSDKGAIPAPLVGVEGGGWLGPRLDPVAAQDSFRVVCYVVFVVFINGFAYTLIPSSNA